MFDYDLVAPDLRYSDDLFAQLGKSFSAWNGLLGADSLAYQGLMVAWAPFVERQSCLVQMHTSMSPALLATMSGGSNPPAPTPVSTRNGLFKCARGHTWLEIDLNLSLSSKEVIDRHNINGRLREGVSRVLGMEAELAVLLAALGATLATVHMDMGSIDKEVYARPRTRREVTENWSAARSIVSLMHTVIEQAHSN